MENKKIVIPGGAGLVGQNLVAQFKKSGYRNLVVIDKHKANLAILRKLHSDIVIEQADLAEPGQWEAHFKDADTVIMLQAQIGAPTLNPFVRNNIETTKRILELIKQYNVPYTVHISSSVVESIADDYYTQTKKQQEDLVLASGISCIILRPTLMFGWFDRKHLGWLSRLMRRIPIFPIPGNGRFMRQPLYANDFCRIIVSCVQSKMRDKVFNITGLEKIDYIDMIRTIKKEVNAKTIILSIPYHLFYILLKVWALFDKNPPFTAQQLKALVAHDEFEVIDWPHIFNVESTPFQQAIHETFNDPIYSKIVMEF